MPSSLPKWPNIVSAVALNFTHSHSLYLKCVQQQYSLQGINRLIVRERFKRFFIVARRASPLRNFDAYSCNFDVIFANLLFFSKFVAVVSW